MSRTYRKTSRATHNRKTCPTCQRNLFERQLPLPFDEGEPEEFPLVQCECYEDEDE